ncbi:cyclase family protein [Legionella hackeliae]|uniref:Putative cyclase n=1 Tax=Legionella hackeliae TaxID=449 RepID=A0A0A8UQL4_LEGHA|nr:cyclase family protein [Legionella hackeliae]KTD09573.1 metal-dependent hydrolase [Legionella hackeliae]CEK11110.1 putative cyclase [Legionella hackeliae]STX47862.1 metal-dependent hydrolase [Legionella hackeliae]
MSFAYTLVDLTHVLTDSIPSWEGNCGFRHQNLQDYDASLDVSFRVQHLTMDAGIGTHMDAPAHCVKDGKTIADFDLNELLAPCVVIDVSSTQTANNTVIPEDIFAFEDRHGEIGAGSFVIIRTGWERYWNSPRKYRNNYNFPSLGAETAKLLLNRNISGLGIDTLSPDRPDAGYPVHQLILGAGKYIVENIANSGLLPPMGSYILVLPLKINEGTEAPVRLVALLKK